MVTFLLFYYSICFIFQYYYKQDFEDTPHNWDSKKGLKLPTQQAYRFSFPFKFAKKNIVNERGIQIYIFFFNLKCSNE